MKLAEGDIADGNIKKVIREGGFLIITLSAAVSALIVSIPRDGIQSMSA